MKKHSEFIGFPIEPWFSFHSPCVVDSPLLQSNQKATPSCSQELYVEKSKEKEVTDALLNLEALYRFYHKSKILDIDTCLCHFWWRFWFHGSRATDMAFEVQGLSS